MPTFLERRRRRQKGDVFHVGNLFLSLPCEVHISTFAVKKKLWGFFTRKFIIKELLKC